MKRRQRKPTDWRSLLWLILAGLVVLSMLGGEFLMLFSPAP